MCAHLPARPKMGQVASGSSRHSDAECLSMRGAVLDLIEILADLAVCIYMPIKTQTVHRGEISKRHKDIAPIVPYTNLGHLALHPDGHRPVAASRS